MPVLPARDLRRTLEFYERLGFENLGTPPEEWGYMIIGRGSIQLHFTHEPSADPLSTASTCFLYVDDVDRLYAAWNPHVVADETTGSRLEPPEDLPWGMRTLTLVDPNGNLVRAGTQG